MPVFVKIYKKNMRGKACIQFYRLTKKRNDMKQKVGWRIQWFVWRKKNWTKDGLFSAQKNIA